MEARFLFRSTRIKRHMKFRTSYLLLLAGLVFGSCTDVMHVDQVRGPEDSIRLSAGNSMMITKAGLEYENFEVGTKYLLYGVQAETEDNYDWSGAIMDRTECHETDDHLIYYGTDLHFRENTYDFFGATVCSTDRYPSTDAGDSRHIPLSLTDGVLDDLMYSNTLKGCTKTSGLLHMNFIHALSKIQIEVSKQNDSEDLRFAKIHRLTMKNTHKSGTLDIVSGTWTLGETGDRLFCDATSDPLELSTSGTMIVDASGNDAEMLIFPNESGETLSLEVVYSVDEGQTIQTIVCPIYKPKTDAKAADGPFSFTQNHRYTLSVSIANDGVHVVTVLPKVYEWISTPVDSYLGQPVTFGNLMWMDRNLGAISADYENDWYNTIGHYFQFGRNIPYILDIEKFREYTGDKYGNVSFAEMTVFVMEYHGKKDGVTYDDTYYYDDTGTYYTRKINAIAANSYYLQHKTEWNGLDEGQKTELILKAVQCIYTYDHLGRKVYGTKYVAPDDLDGTDDKVGNDGHELARSPDRLQDYNGLDDEQISELYKFGFGTKQPGVTSNLKYPTVWTFNEACGKVYWESGHPQKDPCPKGWRLPSKEDLEVLMPTVQINWNDIDYSASETKKVIKSDVTVEEIKYGKVGNHHVCYILKNPGKANAYRLRIQSHFTGDGYDNKRYFSIARFGVKEDGNNLDYYLTDANKDILWENPIEVIKYPACGFIVPDSDGTPETVHPDLRSFGSGTVLRTSDSNPLGLAESSKEGFNFVQYLSTTDYQLGIQTNSRRSLGDQIRCVRDINAVD